MELQALPNEENSKIGDYLGLQSATTQADADKTSSSQASIKPNSSAEAVSMPLVFQTVNPAVMKLTDDQMQVVNDLRKDFINEIGGPNQDPTDPGYLKRWKKAQPEMDGMLRGMLGISFFENYQLAATGNPPTASNP